MMRSVSKTRIQQFDTNPRVSRLGSADDLRWYRLLKSRGETRGTPACKDSYAFGDTQEGTCGLEYKPWKSIRTLRHDRGDDDDGRELP